jgi:hypothetical protein
VEHLKRSPGARTLAAMMVAVNLTALDIAEALNRRKIRHLRRIGGTEQLFQ